MAGRTRRHRISDYKFSEYSHSKEGIAGSILGFISIIILLVCVQISYVSKGEAALPIGAVAIDAIVLSLAGFVMSVKGYKNEDVYKMFPKLGILVTGFSALIWTVVIILGAL